MRAALAVVALLAAVPVGVQAAVDSLPRHAMAGAAVEPLGGDSAGVRVTGVSPGYTAAGLGLAVGDVILEVDGQRIRTLIDYARAFRAWRAPAEVRMTVRRGGAERHLRGRAVPRPRETGDGIEVTYGSVVSDSGDLLRTVVTRPAGRRGPLPAVVLVSWLSCSTVEFSGPNDRPGWRNLLQGLSRAGYLVLRVEKPGVGDSRGPDCSELGLWREIAAYQAGLTAALDRPDVDKASVFLFGGSLGASVAPIVARGRPIRGLVASGGFARTWYEHILGHERRRLELSGTPPAEVHDRMRDLEELYAEYLIQRRAPEEIIRDRPELASVWTDMPRHQYGRPVRFFHELQRVNVAEAWTAVDAPVLVMYGEYDWMMAREDHELMARTVNSRAPGRARLAVLRRVDHHFMRYPARDHAFREDGGVVATDALDTMIRWLAAARLETAAATPQADDTAESRREVMAVVRGLMTAMERKDTAGVRSAFGPGARLIGMRPKDGGQTLSELTPQAFADYVGRDTRGRWVEKLGEPEVRIDETLASVWVPYEFRFGTKLSHCGTDAFHLLRFPEGWKIMSLADTYKTKGCEASP
jgi:pimeloyl-ACP methyl ester carboxylesterase